MIQTENIEAALRYINLLRRDRKGKIENQRLIAAENLASILFESDTYLAVYGSLMPGKKNHQVVSGISGNWFGGYVEGDWYDSGWAKGIGYPGFRWRSGGSRVDVQVLHAPSLPNHWPRLDDFEGEDYHRILVPVYSLSGIQAVANLYETRHQFDV